MRPRRPVFAKDYIGETVEFYETAVRLRDETTNSGIDVGELSWAHNVLAQYFEIVDVDRPGRRRAADPSSSRSPSKRCTADVPAVRPQGRHLQRRQLRAAVGAGRTAPLGALVRRPAGATRADRQGPVGRPPVAHRVQPPAVRVPRLRRPGAGEEGRGDPERRGRLPPPDPDGDRRQGQARLATSRPATGMSSTSTRRSRRCGSCSPSRPSAWRRASSTGRTSSRWSARWPRRSALRPQERVIMLIAVGYADPEG